ncbi:MAG: ATP-binding protein [Candidatus Caenarcaniphilales bacterium]|nr:ATP-binding protein [Candidatus Caenarcaniphilales bacterium]
MLENLILAQTVDLIDDPVIASDERGRVVFTNTAHAKISGWSEQELKGRNKRLLYEIPDEEASKKTGRESTEAVLYRKDGTKLTLSATCSPLQLPELVDEEIGQIVIFHLPKFGDEDQPKTSDDFVSTVSHELRTPLTSIKGFAETLIQSADKIKPEDRIRFLKIIKDQADHLTRLVEDLLFVSRLDNHKIHLIVREIELKRSIDKVCEALSTQAGSRIFIYDFDKALPPVMADSDRVEQILSNLVSNAIKYSPENTNITIRVKANEDKTKAIISIVDQGVGITEDDQQIIFNRFSRLDNPLTRKTKGTGLGLYITKSLVQSMNGDIYLEKSNPKETIFSFTLPLVKEKNI